MYICFLCFFLSTRMFRTPHDRQTLPNYAFTVPRSPLPALRYVVYSTSGFANDVTFAHNRLRKVDASRPYTQSLTLSIRPREAQKRGLSLTSTIALFYDGKDFFQKSYRQIEHVRKRTENLMAFGCATVCETREREDEQRDRQADKTFLFCESFPPQPFLFFFRTDYVDSPDVYCYS